MGIVNDALAEIRTAQTLARGVCPVVEQQFLHRTRHHTLEPWDALTAFCTICPDNDLQHWDCPEMSRDAYDDRAPVCVLYRQASGSGAKTPEGNCPYAQPGRYQCGCFQPKGEAWWSAFNAWAARRQREEAQDERVAERRAAAVLVVTGRTKRGRPDTVVTLERQMSALEGQVIG